MSDEHPRRTGWTSNEEIAAMLDVSTAACTLCGTPARVPEDVVAVKRMGSKRTPIVICIDCQPAYAEKLREMLDALQRKEQDE